MGTGAPVTSLVHAVGVGRVGRGASSRPLPHVSEASQSLKALWSGQGFGNNTNSAFPGVALTLHWGMNVCFPCLCSQHTEKGGWGREQPGPVLFPC